MLNLAVFITGLLVSLAVGFGMVDGILSVRLVPEVVTRIAGWLIVVMTLLWAGLAIWEKFTN